LPAPDGAAFISRQYEAPEGEVEEALARMWSELLAVERVGRQDNFFEMGGHSLLAVRVVSRVKVELSVDLPLPEVFFRPTVASLADAIVEAQLAQFNPDELADLLSDV
jgi:acyl carrier protein